MGHDEDLPAALGVLSRRRLGERICELAGHLTAATCQFLLLIADFDERRGWADWQMTSCAAWLSWKCQLAPGTAREQVRVARSLAQYPLIRQEFAAGRLSYAKARALTRIVTQQTEADRDQPRPARRLSWGPAGDLDYQIRAVLPAEAAAVVFQALRAARNDLEHPHDDHDHGDGEHEHAGDGDSDVSAETRLGRLGRQDARAGTSLTNAQPPPAEMESTENLADALVQICAGYLGARAATADNPDTYQVIIHAGVRAITGAEPGTGPEQAAAGFAFYTKDGTQIPRCPQLPRGLGDITTTHDAAITPATINPPHSGERLNLSLAIWIAFSPTPAPKPPAAKRLMQSGRIYEHRPSWRKGTRWPITASKWQETHRLGVGPWPLASPLLIVRSPSADLRRLR
jgi:Domain of unknown function (DUF222)